MANIQRSFERQYFAKQLPGHEVSEGIKQVGDTVVDTMGTVLNVTQKANEAKLANYQVDLSTKWMAKNNEINTKYQADPTNPEREKDLDEAFGMLASEYEINPLCEGQWSRIKDNVYNRYKEYNAQWSIKQQQTNAQLDLKNGYESLNDQISMMGMNGASIDEIRLVYANGVEGLRNGATAVLGSVVADSFLKDSDHDVMTTYISSLATNNPVLAQQLLNDPGVINDIGDADTIEKLQGYVASSLKNQHERAAVSDLCNSLRKMNSEDANNILAGRANLNQVMNFIENNKSLPDGSKEMILGIYGIGSTHEYMYDKGTKKIVRKDSSSTSSGSGLVGLGKLNKEEKLELGDNLELAVANMFFGVESEKVNPKKAAKNNRGVDAQNSVLGMMTEVVAMQNAIDTAYHNKIIDKSRRQKMINSYIQPMTDYLENSLVELDEKSNLFGKKLGYDAIKNAFDIEGAGNKKAAIRKNLLIAQGYYYKELDAARQSLGLGSIYELENLSIGDQRRIYKNASDNAIRNTQRYSEHPEIFFKKEYPQLYSQGVNMFGKQDGEIVIRKVAQRIYGAEDDTKIEPMKIMSDVITETKAYKRQKAADLIKSITAVNRMYGDGRVLADYEIEPRANALGLTMSQLTNDALSKGVSPQMYLIYLEQLRKRKK